MFNIQVQSGEFKKALSYLESTVGNNSQGNGDDCISITDNGNYVINMYTTNSVEFSSVSFVVMSGSNGSVERMPYVNFKRFKKIIDSLGDNQYINIKASSNDIEITYGNKSNKPLKLSGSANGMIPLPTVSGNTLSIDTSILRDGLKHACVIIKDDANNRLTNCIRIHTDGFHVEITAVDVRNNRMFLHHSMNTENNQGDVLIEANKFLKAFGMLDCFNTVEFEVGNVVKISGSDCQSNIITNAEYYIRQINGNYPTNIADMFKYANDFATVNKDEMKASLIRIDAIEDTTIGSGTMELLIDKSLVNITKASQYGVVEDSFDLENEISSPIKNTFKTKPLEEVLKVFADSGSAFTPSTFEIANANIPGQNDCYIIKDTQLDTNRYLITGFGSNAVQTP